MYISWKNLITYKQFNIDFPYRKMQDTYKININFYNLPNVNNLSYTECSFLFKNKFLYSRVIDYINNSTIYYFHYFFHIINNYYLYANFQDQKNNNYPIIYYGQINNDMFHCDCIINKGNINFQLLRPQIIEFQKILKAQIFLNDLK